VYETSDTSFASGSRYRFDGGKKPARMVPMPMRQDDGLYRSEVDTEDICVA
jgi:hypothetical protein